MIADLLTAAEVFGAVALVAAAVEVGASARACLRPTGLTAAGPSDQPSPNAVR